MIVATRPDPTVRPPSRYQTDVLRCTNGGFSCDSCGKIRIFRCVCIIFFDFVIMVLSNLNILFPNQIKRNTFFPFVVLFLGNNNLPLFFLLSILFFANSHPILVLTPLLFYLFYYIVTISATDIAISPINYTFFLFLIFHFVLHPKVPFSPVYYFYNHILGKYHRIFSLDYTLLR